MVSAIGVNTLLCLGIGQSLKRFDTLDFLLHLPFTTVSREGKVRSSTFDTTSIYLAIIAVVVGIPHLVQKSILEVVLAMTKFLAVKHLKGLEI